MIHKHSERRREWLKLVREKLVPLKLLTPAGSETHEWSRTYRDLIFEMAIFVDRQGGEITSQLVRHFMANQPANDLIASFSAREIGLLLRKAVEYDLPVHEDDHLEQGVPSEQASGSVEGLPSSRIGNGSDPLCEYQGESGELGFSPIGQSLRAPIGEVAFVD
jgi:hypothetical protein